RAIIEAHEEAGERLSEAVRQARERAWELAEQVARGLATDVDHLRDELQDSLSEQADSVDEALEDAETIPELVEAARAHGVTVDTAALGERDGYEVDETTAVAYATVRTWDGSYPYVQVDLLTGEATRHEG